jgi:hypothetical protein
MPPPRFGAADSVLRLPSTNGPTLREAMCDLGAAEWAGIAGALFAALAAGFALWTALQNRVLLKAALLPELATVVTESEVPRLEIRNGAGGLAMTVLMLWTHRGRYAEGHVVAFLRQGEGVTVAAAFDRQDLDESHSVVACRDVRGDYYYWSLDGHREVARERRWWRRGESSFDLRSRFAKWYPDSDLGSAKKGQWSVPKQCPSCIRRPPFQRRCHPKTSV